MCYTCYNKWFVLGNYCIISRCQVLSQANQTAVFSYCNSVLMLLISCFLHTVLVGLLLDVTFCILGSSYTHTHTHMFASLKFSGHVLCINKWNCPNWKKWITIQYSKAVLSSYICHQLMTRVIKFELENKCWKSLWNLEVYVKNLQIAGM